MIDQSCEAALEQSRRETRAAFENRALMYYHLYEELVGEIGRERAIEVMKRAIHRRGLEVGAKYEELGRAGDLEGVARLFCETSPCEGGLFAPGVEDIEDGRLVLRMDTCPLVEIWRAEGLSAEQVDTLCDIAVAVDYGTFERAGLDLRFLERLGEAEGCRCLLELRTRSGA